MISNSQAAHYAVSILRRLRGGRGRMPALTHQTAASAALTPEQACLRERMIAVNPGWEHRFYDDADCRKVIARGMPRLLAVYDGYTHAIQRADMFRVAVVYLFGGAYLDLDMECMAPLTPLLTSRCVLAEEKTLSAEQAGRLGHAERLRIANYMFASAPRHPFWLAFLNAMEGRAARPVVNDIDILETTGPGLLSTLYATIGAAYPDVVVLPHTGEACPSCGGPSCRFGALAWHRHHGSWRDKVAASA